ncbi:1-deoxy-D-xylulose-5-phosphate reductoisomerase [soil metagenome]
MTNKTRIAILGSTGSVGRQTVSVARAHPDRFEVVALVANRDDHALARQATELRVEHTGLGSEAAVRAASLPEVDVVLNAVVGAAGLRASLAALESGKVLALANKESMVAGGELCRAAAERGGGTIVPVDSEHAAVAQCLEGRAASTVEDIVLTASGGPFRTRADLSSVTPADALAHPTWSMGPKVTVDSASLMNKGLEVIEAHHLFGFGYEHIRVVVHPQSIVHAMVSLRDGSVLMQAASPDMRIPIQAALGWPARFESFAARIDLTTARSLEFEAVDDERFPALGLAYAAGRAGRSLPAVLNAANEEAVHAFLDGAISFLDITRVVEDVLQAHEPFDASELEAVLEADHWARREARRRMSIAASEDLTAAGTQGS